MVRNTRGKAQEELCAPVVLTSVFVIFRYTLAWHPNVVCTSGSVDTPMLAKAQAHPVLSKSHEEDKACRQLIHGSSFRSLAIQVPAKHT